RIHGICAVAHRALLQGPRKLAPRSEVPRLFEVVDVGSVSTSRPDNGRVTTGNLHLVRGGPQGSGARMPAMRAFLKLPTIDLPVVQPRSPLPAACPRVLGVLRSRSGRAQPGRRESDSLSWSVSPTVARSQRALFARQVFRRPRALLLVQLIRRPYKGREGQLPVHVTPHLQSSVPSLTHV